MEENWIRISPYLESSANDIENIRCMISFNGIASIIVDDDDIDYLIGKLNSFKENKVMLMSVEKVEQLLEVIFTGE